jgi:hypothetical protein
VSLLLLLLLLGAGRERWLCPKQHGLTLLLLLLLGRGLDRVTN